MCLQVERFLQILSDGFIVSEVPHCLSVSGRFLYHYFISSTEWCVRFLLWDIMVAVGHIFRYVGQTLSMSDGHEGTHDNSWPPNTKNDPKTAF